MRSRWFGAVTLVVALVFGLAAYGHLPARVASHWNLRGQVNGTMSPLQAVLFMPLIGLGVWLLAHVLPRIDPKRTNYSSFAGTYWLFINVILLFILAVYVAMLGSALGWNVSPSRLAPIGIGVLFAVLGNELGRIKPNWFIGIRTPWTLSDPEVWRQTHRVGGRVFVVVGVLVAVLGLIVPSAAAVGVMLAGVLGSALLVSAYSYVLWRRLQNDPGGRQPGA